jgi:hypothetical protein
MASLTREVVPFWKDHALPEKRPGLVRVVDWEMFRRFLAGESVESLAQHRGVTVGTIRSRLSWAHVVASGVLRRSDACPMCHGSGRVRKSTPPDHQAAGDEP